MLHLLTSQSNLAAPIAHVQIHLIFELMILHTISAIILTTYFYGRLKYTFIWFLMSYSYFYICFSNIMYSSVYTLSLDLESYLMNSFDQSLLYLNILVILIRLIQLLVNLMSEDCEYSLYYIYELGNVVIILQFILNTFEINLGCDKFLQIYQDL